MLDDKRRAKRRRVVVFNTLGHTARNPSLMQLDWKFFTTLLIGIAGVGVPVWLWLADIDAKSLSLNVVSTAGIASPTIGERTNVVVTIDGVATDNPFVSVLELHSDGRRPIAAADFEGPLELTVKPPAVLLSSYIKESTPTDLRPKLTLKAGALFLEPLLLNPGDRFQLTIFTSGQPIFTARSRISGIQRVSVIDSGPSRVARRTWAMRGAGTALLAAYFPLSMGAISSARQRRLHVLQPLAAVSCLVGGLLLIAMPVPSSPIDPLASWPFLLFGMVVGVLASRIRYRFSAA